MHTIDRTMHQHGTIAVFRKGKAPRKLSPEKLTELIVELKRNDRMRVDRSQLLCFMLGGGFAKLPKVTQAQLDAPNGARELLAAGKGWALPESELGRRSMVCDSTVNSVKAQIAKAFGVPLDTLSVVLIRAHSIHL